MAETIDWKDILADSFIKLEDGVNKTLTLRDWKTSTKFDNPGIDMTVVEEDGVLYEETELKEWTVTAKGALRQLQPLIEKAVAAGNDTIKVNVVVIGKGKERKYSIKEITE